MIIQLFALEVCFRGLVGFFFFSFILTDFGGLFCLCGDQTYGLTQAGQVSALPLSYVSSPIISTFKAIIFIVYVSEYAVYFIIKQKNFGYQRSNLDLILARQKIKNLIYHSIILPMLLLDSN